MSRSRNYSLFFVKQLIQNVQLQFSPTNIFKRYAATKVKPNCAAFCIKARGERFTREESEKKLLPKYEEKNGLTKNSGQNEGTSLVCYEKKGRELRSAGSKSLTGDKKECGETAARSSEVDFPKPLLNPSGIIFDMNNFFKNPFSLFEIPIKIPDLLSKSLSNYAAIYSDKGMNVLVDFKGYKEEDIEIRVEGAWLVVEANSTASVPKEKGGGLLHRQMYRRYEIPPNSNVATISSRIEGDLLRIFIPFLQPKITKS